MRLNKIKNKDSGNLQSVIDHVELMDDELTHKGINDDQDEFEERKEKKLAEMKVRMVEKHNKSELNSSILTPNSNAKKRRQTVMSPEKSNLSQFSHMTKSKPVAATETSGLNTDRDSEESKKMKLFKEDDHTRYPSPVEEETESQGGISQSFAEN
jgi:hypothetical protein